MVATTGTNTVKRIRELNTTRNLGMNIINGKDHAESMLLMTTGRADAFFEDDILLTGLAAASAAPNDYALSSDGYSVDPYALMFAKGDAEFKALVDGTLGGLYKSGEIVKIYDKQPEPELRPRRGAEESIREAHRFVRTGRLPMSGAGPDRLPPFPPERWTDEQRAQAQEIVDGPRGALVAPFIPLLRSPELMGHAPRMGEYLRYRSTLGARLSELAILVTARQWSQQVEWAIHAPIAQREGVAAETIAAVAQGPAPRGHAGRRSAGARLLHRAAARQGSLRCHLDRGGAPLRRAQRR